MNPQTKAGVGVRADASSDNKSAAPSIANGRRWMQFDTWLKQYEAATGADSYHPRLPGGPRGL